MRLNKYLSSIGVCSRRHADRMIEEGRVTVDGKIAELGMSVLLGQQIEIDGKPVEQKNDERVLLLVNKPEGIVCTAERSEPDNIIDFLSFPSRIYPVGRLDKDSHGLILMTNIGSLCNEITRAANGHEKEYIVKVDKRISSDFVKNMEKGVYLPELEVTTMPAKVKKLSEKEFSIILKEGRNRQIRRMCRQLGYRVSDLERIRVMDFKLDGIEEGKYRRASEKELEVLDMLINGRAD